MDSVNRGGKPFIIYMDGEFQTFSQPIKDDKLLQAGFKLTTPFVHRMRDMSFATYQFLLNFAFIVYDGNQVYMHMITFPSLFDAASAPFSNGLTLEPGYTIGTPSIIEQAMASRPKVPKFTYYSDYASDPIAASAATTMTEIYNKDANANLAKSLEIFNWFLHQLLPKSKVVHKGDTDLDAIFNTCAYYNLQLPKIDSRDLDKSSMHYVQLNGTDHRKNLGTLQSIFCKRDADLFALREYLLHNVKGYVITKYGGTGEGLAAHNPLVDCVFTIILDIATKRYFP